MRKAYLICDLGNSLIKMVLLNSRGTVKAQVDFPHAIRTSDFDTFERTRKFRQSTSANQLYERFMYRGMPVAVGRAAENRSDPRKTGGPKYSRDYITLLFLSGALRLLPDGHDNLTVMAMHPPSDIQHAAPLRKALGGKHVVTTADGTKVTFAVREVYTMDEPVGGVRHFLLAPGGMGYRHEHIDDRMAICIDVGGQISSFTPFYKDGDIDYELAERWTLNAGVRDVMAEMSRLLKGDQFLGPQLKQHRGSALPEDANMRTAIHRGIYNVQGKDQHVNDLRDEATRPLILALHGLWEDQILAQGMAPAYVVVTGGGGGLLFDKIMTQVLDGYNKEAVHMVEPDFPVIHYANVYGAVKVMQAMIVDRMDNA